MDIERGVAYDRGFAEGKDEGYKAGSSVLFASEYNKL
jgi:flagellar biosynthesis/type III secretory pathway protein FliH